MNRIRKLGFVLVALLMIGMCGNWLYGIRSFTREHSAAVAARETEVEEPRYVTVRSGDTLWAIASRAYPGEHIGKRIYEIKQANVGVSLDIIRPGQVLSLP